MGKVKFQPLPKEVDQFKAWVHEWRRANANPGVPMPGERGRAPPGTPAGSEPGPGRGDGATPTTPRFSGRTIIIQVKTFIFPYFHIARVPRFHGSLTTIIQCKPSRTITGIGRLLGFFSDLASLTRSEFRPRLT